MKPAFPGFVLILPFLALPVACGGATFSSEETDGGGGNGGSTSSGAGSGSSGAGGGSTSGSGSGGSSGGVSSGSSGSGGVSSGSSGADSGLVPSCPSPPGPASGGACMNAGLECEYGSNPVQSCDVVATCTQSQWQVVGPATSNTGSPSQTCSTAPGPGCPSTFASVPQGASCQNSTLECDYPQGRCACSEGGGPIRIAPDGGVAAFWACQSPASGCPVPRARLGSACTQNLTCDYGSCSVPGGTAETCQGGVWKEAFTPCPLAAGAAP
jgi:hypothetical protein